MEIFICCIFFTQSLSQRIFISCSVDYIPHPLEKQYVHQGEKYRQPEGEMDMMTNYLREYTSIYDFGL